MLAIKIAKMLHKKTLCSLNFHIFLQEYQFVHISAKRRDLLAVTMSPAVEKTRSLGTDVPWTARLRWANLQCEDTYAHCSSTMRVGLHPQRCSLWPCMRWPLHEWCLTKALFFFPCFIKMCKYHCHGRFFSGEERSLMALAPLLRMNGRLGFTALTLMSIWQITFWKC